MLWYKGWLETRWRLFICVAFYIAAYILAALHPAYVSHGMPASAAALVILQSNYTVYGMAFTALILSGAGIDTRPAFQGNRGQESRLFTLSLPVTRAKLLGVRAGLGWMELCVSLVIITFGNWAALWPLRESIEFIQVVRFTLACIVCASGLYAVTTLLSSFLEGTSKFQISLLTFAAIWWVMHRLQIPVSVDVFWGPAKDSAMLAYTMPWTAMTVCLTSGAILFFVTLRIVQIREY